MRILLAGNEKKLKVYYSVQIDQSPFHCASARGQESNIDLLLSLTKSLTCLFIFIVQGARKTVDK